MILQFRTLEPIAELGAVPGDMVSFDVEECTAVVMRDIDFDTAATIVSQIHQRLIPLELPLPADAAAALLIALTKGAPVQPTRARKARLRVMHEGGLRVLKGGAS